MELTCTGVITTNTPSSDEKKVEDVIDTIVFFYKLYMDTWSDSAYSDFIKAFNVFLEEISPISYVPSLACEIDKNIYMNLWDAGINPSLLRKTLLDVYRVLRSRKSADELKRDLREIVSIIGDESAMWDIIEKTSSVDQLVSIAILTLIIGTNF